MNKVEAISKLESQGYIVRDYGDQLWVGAFPKKSGEITLVKIAAVIHLKQSYVEFEGWSTKDNTNSLEFLVEIVIYNFNKYKEQHS